MIVAGREQSGPVSLRTHTLVVGSGSGGAPVAHALATAGVDVLVVEEGPHYLGRDMTQRDDEMMPALYRARGQQPTADGLVNVLQGSCVGGSTVINAADCEPTPEPVLEHWRRRFGLDLDAGELAEAQARVFAMLGVRPILDAQINRNNGLLAEGARRLGWKTGAFLHNREGCIGSGYCMVGCAYDAKKGAHLNYLPKAVEAGARLHCDVRIERIEPRTGGGFRARGFVVERGPRTPRLPYEVHAERIVLAAGAVHSPAVLHASGLGRRLPALGRHVSLQPQLPVAGVFAEDVAVVPWRGIPQATFCSEFDDNTPEHGLGGFRFEAVSVGMAQVAASFGGFGRAQKRFMAGLRHTGAALLLVPDRPSGRMTWRLGERGFVPRIEYAMTHDWVTRLRRGLRATAEAWLAAGAREVWTSSDVFGAISGRADLDRALAFPIRTGVTRFISAHVQGTCRMGADPGTSVVDLEHRVHGVPGLFVVDASVFPTTASTHTMIPTMTFAERAARRLVAAA